MFLLGIIWIHGLSGYANPNPLTLSLLHLIWQKLFTSFFFTPVMPLSLSLHSPNTFRECMCSLCVWETTGSTFLQTVSFSTAEINEILNAAPHARQLDMQIQLIGSHRGHCFLYTPPQVTRNCQWTFGPSSSRAGWDSLTSVVTLKASNQRGVAPGTVAYCASFLLRGRRKETGSLISSL